MLINLNWNQKQGGGLFNRKNGVDLDLACLYELKNGSKGVVQALGNAFGSLNQPPYVLLDGDDRTGSVTTGENLRINGSKIADIERILIFLLFIRVLPIGQKLTVLSRLPRVVAPILLSIWTSITTAKACVPSRYFGM